MNRGVIVLAPPWPRSGSGNIIAAQTAAHARRDARVLLLLTPLGRGHSRSKVHLWRDAVSAMAFPGVDSVAYLRASRGTLRSYLRWLLAGRDDSIAISARYAASGTLPNELAEFVASTRIDLIHANHVFSVPLAQRIAAIVHDAQGHRPPILLETHDIQSDAFGARRQKNPHSRQIDARADLIRTELALCAKADTLVHVTQADCEFFLSRLPGKNHEVIAATLDPTSEAELVKRRGVQRQADFDFIYVGNRHQANLETLRWLLGEVLPLAGPRVAERIRIVGTIGNLLRSRDPVLYSAWERLCVGEVPSVHNYYEAATAVLAPATAGTGTSIKLVEALCAGKPIVTTTLALRGLPAGEMTGDIHVHDTAAGFAGALRQLSGSSAPAAITAASTANAALYDRLFSNARYFAALDHVLDTKMGRGHATCDPTGTDPIGAPSVISHGGCHVTRVRLQEMPKQMLAKIHYDVTDIWEYGRHHATLSGIQRVSIQLLSHIVNKHGTDRLSLIGWHPIRKRILSFDASYFLGEYKYDQEDFCRHFGLSRGSTGGADLKAYLKRKYAQSWKRRVHRARLLLVNTLTAGRTFEKRKITSMWSGNQIGPHMNHLALYPEDLVFFVGATWNFDEYLSALARERRSQGVAICRFVHDLIPLLASEHVVDDVPAHFARWLNHVSRNTDYFLTNSQATKRDLDAWLAENGVDVPTGVLPLAHQFGDSTRQNSLDLAPTDSRIHARVRNAARLPYALCVGSIESRKNIWTLANVWRRIHARLGESTPRLIFAGNPGWLRDDFDDFIRGTGSLYGYIRVLERPSDTELAFLYQRCLFSVFPSYKEGWGLPVGEGLWFGRPVVCSNTSAMPEVGGSLADYIDPASWESIEAALLKMITDAGYRERRAAQIAAARLRTWSDVADDLWRELTRVVSANRGMANYEANQALASAGRDQITPLSQHEGRA